MCKHGDRLTGDIVRKLWFSFAIPIARLIFRAYPGYRVVWRASGGASEGEDPTCVSRCLRIPSLFSVARSSIGEFSRGKLYVPSGQIARGVIPSTKWNPKLLRALIIKPVAFAWQIALAIPTRIVMCVCNRHYYAYTNQFVSLREQSITSSLEE